MTGKSVVHPDVSLALGIATAILGAVAIYLSAAFTLISVFFIGVLVLAAGIVQLFNSPAAKRWPEITLHFFLAVIYIVAGFLLMSRPLAGAVSLTLFIGVFYLVSGIARIFIAATARISQRGWAVLSGIITTVLGLLILSGWPVISFWLIGLFFGVDMLFLGIYLTFHSVELRSLDRPRDSAGRLRHA